MIFYKSICGGQLVTDYEAKLVKEYESNGLEFLCVVSGGDSIDLNIEVAHEYGIPVREVFRVQGDCIGYDTKNDLWNSRWLMFRHRDWQALCGNSLESSFAMQTGGIEMDLVSKEDVRAAFDNADADVMADYGSEYGCEWGFSRDAVNRILDSVDASVEHFTLGQEVWIVERDEDGEAYDIGGYVFISEVAGYAILTPYVNDHGDLEYLLDYHRRDTCTDFNADLTVVFIDDCYASRASAQAALDKEAD